MFLRIHYDHFQTLQLIYLINKQVLNDSYAFIECKTLSTLLQIAFLYSLIYQNNLLNIVNVANNYFHNTLCYYNLEALLE